VTDDSSSVPRFSLTSDGELVEQPTDAAHGLAVLRVVDELECGLAERIAFVAGRSDRLL